MISYPYESLLAAASVKALVFGDNRPFNVALVFPDWELVRSWAEAKAGAKTGASMGELSSLEGVRNLIAGEIALSLDGFKKYEVRFVFGVVVAFGNSRLTANASVIHANLVKIKI